MSTVTFSGNVARNYDEVQGPVYFEPYAIETAARVAILNPQNVLETACGTGRVTNHLRKVISPDASLTATDISADMMAIAREKLSSVNNISWLEADALHLPFADQSFDVVVCQFGAMFFPDKKKGFSEAWRVLKSGGIYLVTTWAKLEMNEIAAAGRNVLKAFFDNNPPANMNVAFQMHNKNEIHDLLTESGFININIESVVKISVAESAAALASAIVEGSLIRDFVIQKDASAIPVLKEQTEAAIREKCGDHPVTGKMEAIYCMAQKQ
jgi:ubiquinone/menaquinone biosynthesis C-methylase UbiE